MATQHFCFLNLPKELRLMCYERIPITTHHHSLRGISPSSPTLTFSNATFVTKTIPCSILTVCRLIHTEASSILAPLLQHLRASPTRLIVELGASKFMFTVLKIAVRLVGQSSPNINSRNDSLLTFLEQTHAIDKPAATSFVVKLAASMARSYDAPRVPALVVAVTQGPCDLPDNASTQFTVFRRRICSFMHVCNRRLSVWHGVEGLMCGFSIVLPKNMDLHLDAVTTTHEYVQRDSAKLKYYIRAEELGEEEWRQEWEVGEWSGC